MVSKMKAKSSQSGFSLIEVTAVVGVILVIGAMATPYMVTATASLRLRGGMNSLAGMFQECRAVAIKDNALRTTKFTTMAGGPVVYVKDATLTGTSAAITALDPQAGLGAPVSRITSLSTYTGAPTELTSTTLGYTPAAGDPELTFNPRGLPCVYASGTCTSPAGFAFYFTDKRPLGKNGWAAVTVSPAGRVKVWVWTGSAWSS
jgi:prepilin-type N-terminal cleavage/methylation domain-containing protein